MAVFVDLDDDDVELPQHGQPHGLKPTWNGTMPSGHPNTEPVNGNGDGHHFENRTSSDTTHREEAAHEPAVDETPNSVTVALGCYP